MYLNSLTGYKAQLIFYAEHLCCANARLWATLEYAKITSQKLNNDLTMLGDKLNASFSNIKIA